MAVPVGTVLPLTGGAYFKNPMTGRPVLSLGATLELGASYELQVSTDGQTWAKAAELRVVQTTTWGVSLAIADNTAVQRLVKTA